MKTEIQSIVWYIANDGRRFLKKELCEKHEAKENNPVSAKNVTARTIATMKWICEQHYEPKVISVAQHYGTTCITSGFAREMRRILKLFNFETAPLYLLSEREKVSLIWRFKFELRQLLETI